LGLPEVGADDEQRRREEDRRLDLEVGRLRELEETVSLDRHVSHSRPPSTPRDRARRELRESRLLLEREHEPLELAGPLLAEDGIGVLVELPVDELVGLGV